MSDEQTENSAHFDLTAGAQDQLEIDPNAVVTPGADTDSGDEDNGEEDETLGAPTEVVVEGRPLKRPNYNEPVESEVKDTDFYYPTHLDPMRQLVSTSGYLDDKQRYDAEKIRAKVEDREPDLENPPAMQSTPLYTDNEVASTGLSTHDAEPDAVLPVVITKS